jgi:PTS system N-acetylglucosamine-specific IIC component
VTEPVEFAFMFLAPPLYALHALLTGASMALMHLLGVRLGFTFSAGAIDYVLSYGLSSRGWLLLPIGAAYFAVYYVVFAAAIRRFGLATPGREPASAEPPPLAQGAGEEALAFVRALGGAANLVSVDACTTRLRLVLADDTRVDRGALEQLGARGIVRPGRGTLQVVLGPQAELVADAIRAAIHPSTASSSDVIAVDPPRAAPADIDRGAWLAALGGEANLLGAEAVATTRLRLELGDADRLDAEALHRLGARGVMRFSSTLVHVLLGSECGAVASALRGQAPEARARKDAAVLESGACPQS